MARELQALLVELQARDERFAAVLTNVETRIASFERKTAGSLTRIEGGFSKLTGVVSKVTTGLGLLASAAALGGLTSLATDALDAAGTLVDFSDRVGISTERLQELQFAASQAGLSSEAFQTGIVKFSRILAEANSGFKQSSDLLEKLGFNVAELGKDPARALEIVADRMSTLENQSQRVQVAIELFGKSGAGFVNFLQNGSDEIQRMTQRARDLGVVIEDGLLRQSEELGDNFEAVSKVLSVQFQQALLAIAPLLVKTAEYAASLARGITSVAQAVGLLNVPLRQQITDTSQRVFELQQRLTDLRDIESKNAAAGRSPNFSTGRQIAQTTQEIDKLTSELTSLQKEYAKTTPQIKAEATEYVKLSDSVDKADKAKKKIKETSRDVNEALKDQLSVLQEQGKILDAVLDGTIDYEQAQTKLSAAQKTGKGQSQQLADAVAKLDEENRKKTKTIEDLIEAEKKLGEEEDRQLAQNLEQRRAVETDIALNNKLAKIINDGIASKRDLKAIERDLAIEREKARLITQKFTGDEAAFAAAVVDSSAALQQSEADFASYRESLEEGLDLSGIIQDGIRGLAQGTLQIGSFLKQQGQALAVEFGNAFLFGKRGTLDAGLKLNISQLVGGPSGGIIGSLAQAGGGTIGNLFGSSFANAAGSTAVADFSNVIAGSSSTAASVGTSWGTVFGSAAAGAAGLAIGSGISSALGLNGGGLGGTLGGVAGGIGGFILGGPGGAALGSAVGNIFGSFIESLFKSKPSKGTRVRKEIKEFLKDIGASFASEIDSGDYFFEETKKLADKMFGGDFLDASKKILNDKAGPELAQQLQALGTFLTASQAKKIGKSVEQTGTTFGNLLLDNLGLDPDTISDAIDEIVDKANISFADLVNKLNDLVRDADISMEFYTDAINGAIQLFLEDLPNAITRAAAVQKSFTEEGILDIKRLEEEITKAASQFDATAAAIGGAFSKRIVEGLDREETKQAFLDLIKDALANATIASFVAEQIPKLLEGIDFTQPLSLSSEAMAALAEQVGIASDNLYALLEAAGLLPDVIEETNDKVEDVVDSTKDLEEQAQNIVSQIRQIENDLTSLAQKRVTIRLDLVERLASIGSISTLQAINTKAQALLAQIDTIQALTAEGTGVTELTTEKLDQLFAAHSQLADLIVARFNAEADAIRQNGQLAIDQIHAEYEAKRQAISDTIDGLNDSRQLTQEYYAEQIEGLQENLRIAQEFQQVSKQIGQSIAQLVTGPQSALSRSEQSAFLDARIASLRQQPLTAEVASELSQLLQQRLGASLSQQGSVAFFEEFSGVIQQLQDLETTTGAQGETALTIQTQIKNIEEQSRIALASIDAQIEQQQDLLADLSRQEQQAVLRAQQQTELKIAELRTVAERQLRENAAQQDRIAAEAQTKREQQRQLLVGIEKATQLLSDPNNALIVTLVEMGAVLDRLNNTLASITPAATGFEGLLTKPRLFLAGERGPEYVSISPSGTRSGGMATTINAPLTVNLSGRATEEDGQRLARGYIEALKYEIRHSDLGVAIQQRVLGR